MMYFTDHRAAKQTRLGLGTVQNQIHPKSLGWPSGSHNHKVNLPRPLEKFTQGIYNLASLKTLLSRLTLETESSKALSGIVFMPAQKLYVIVWTLPQNLRLRSTLSSIYSSTKRYFS